MNWREFWELHRKACLAGVVVAGVLVGSWIYSRFQATTPAFSMASSSIDSSSAGSPVTHTTASKVCVDVKGAINHPGVYTLSKGSRVQEAVDAAGGTHTDADMRQVNLAKQLQDQQVVYVPARGEEPPVNLMTAMTGADAANSMSTVSDSPKINLNQASKEQLCQINGIGDKKADMILQYRQQHGEFKSIDDLKNVDGFGDKTVAKLRDQVAV